MKELTAEEEIDDWKQAYYTEKTISDIYLAKIKILEAKLLELETDYKNLQQSLWDCEDVLWDCENNEN